MTRYLDIDIDRLITVAGKQILILTSSEEEQCFRFLDVKTWYKFSVSPIIIMADA